MVKHMLLSLILCFSTNIFAAPEFLSVRSYVDTEFESMFEIKVFEYPKIILDCQSFFHQLVIYETIEGSLQRKDSYTLDFSECYQAHEFLYQSQMSKEPVCLMITQEDMSIGLSNKDSDHCK
ncbi:hypothetical protein A9Q84_07695 [Halobacteriovorax marinus]|uniref:Secreted protein n=1 Tax=Halobacteriovorax marinus TaxID=97084 RepID=A0A1Y5FC80_9BACT|nr:hypothetical protein A9Q84_07695 [Halobacteriovorax marinus]